MTRFESLDDVHKARLPPNLLPVAHKAMQAILTSTESYDPTNDGYVALIDDSDSDAVIASTLGRKWRESCFEDVIYLEMYTCYQAWILRDNQCCITILVPNQPEIDICIRSRLLQAIGAATE